MLSDRKKKILQVVIDDYISSASPVSSKAIHDSHFDDLSPATIRNELASLEELGFLTHPHTSAGRVPTTMAYKQYIDGLVRETKVTERELQGMKKYFSANIRETEYIANNVVKVLSDLTNYTSIATVSKVDKEKIQSLKLIKFSENCIVLIVMSASGKVNDYKIYGNFLEGDEYLTTAENILNRYISGKSLAELSELTDDIKGEFSAFKALFNSIFETLKKSARENDNLYLMGESKIFEHPEYNNIENVKDFLTAIDDRENLRKILNDNVNPNVTINVSMGDEKSGLPKDFSIVTANYKIQDVDYGTYGVIGPTRMDYEKVFKVLNGIRDILIDLVNDKNK